MMEFVQALRDFAFLQQAVAAGALSGVACGIMGSYVVTRRITYLAAAIAHCTLGGMGAARYLQVVHGWEWCSPQLGAVVAALVAAFVVGSVSLWARQREDTVIGAVWAGGMALGILFISRTPGYSEDLMAYLFGDILMVTRRDLVMVVALDAVIVTVVAVWHKPLLAVCFDEEFARLRGVPVQLFYLLLLCLTALTVVLLVPVVGIIMVIALLSLPAGIACQFSRTLGQTMAVSVVLCVLFTVGGLALSYGPDLPAGATIIVVAGAVFLLVTGVKAVLGRGK